MDFNLTTFILEIVNFLALVWVLKVLLYAPVQRILQERSERASAALEESRKAQEKAKELQARYDGRLKDWESEKAHQREAFLAELEALKARHLALLKETLEKERLKSEKAEEKRRSQAMEAVTREALRQSAAFAAKVFSRAATVETEARIVDWTLTALSDEGKFRALFPGVPEGKARALTAHPLAEKDKHRLKDLLRRYLGEGTALEFAEDPSLLAGLEITVGAVVIAANLRDELLFFAQAGVP